MRGNVVIGNKRKGGLTQLDGFTSVDVDRSNPILGNPHVLSNWKDDEERQEVLDDYKVDYDTDWHFNGPMKQETLKLARRVYKGENLLLLCWCHGKPSFKACHAEQIVARIEEILAPYR
jgi:hypothetical protein